MNEWGPQHALFPLIPMVLTVKRHWRDLTNNTQHNHEPETQTNKRSRTKLKTTNHTTWSTSLKAKSIQTFTQHPSTTYNAQRPIAARCSACTVISDLSAADAGVLSIGISIKRRKKLKELVDTVIHAQSLSSGLAASIYGKSRFMMSPVYASMGKACLQPLPACEYQKSEMALTEDLRESLKFISFVCVQLPTLRSL